MPDTAGRDARPCATAGVAVVEEHRAHVSSDSKSCLVTYLSKYIDLDDDDLALVADLEREERAFEPDARVQSRGDSLQHLYVVKSGWLYLSTDLADGRRHVVRIHHAGDVVGLSDLASREVTTNLTACTRAVLCPFPKGALDKVIVRAPRLTALLMAMSARDQVLCIDMLRATARMSARERVIFLLLTLLHRLRMTRGDEGDGFDCPLNQTHIGDLLGLTNVSVSKAMVELEQAGTIARRRQHVTLLDIPRSAAAVEFVDRFGEFDTSWFPDA